MCLCMCGTGPSSGLQCTQNYYAPVVSTAVRVLVRLGVQSIHNATNCFVSFKINPKTHILILWRLDKRLP